MNPHALIRPPHPAALWLVALLVIVPFYRLLTVDVGSVSLSIVDAMIMASATLLASALLWRTPIHWPKGMFTGAIGAFLLSIGLSMVHAYDPSRSFHYLLSITLDVLLFVVVYQCLQSRKALRAFSLVYCLSVSFLSVIAMFQAATAMFEVGTPTSVSGTFFVRNEMVSYILPGFAIAFGTASTPGRWRPAFILCSFVTFSAIVVSRGRAGLLLAALMALVALVAAAKRGNRATSILFVLGWLAVTVPTTYLLVHSSRDDLGARYTTSAFSEVSGERGSLWARIRVLQGLANAFLERPILGIGADNFTVLSGHFIPLANLDAQHNFYKIQPHNSYAGALAETGVVGLGGLLFLVIVGLSGFRALKLAPAADRGTILGVMLGYLSIVMFLASYDGISRYIFWILLAAAMATRSVMSRATIRISVGVPR